MKKENVKRICWSLFIILSEIFIYFQMVIEKTEITIKYKLTYIAICILANFALLVLFWYLNKKEIVKIEKVFLLIAVFFGILYLLFIPALLGTDELPHFLRPYQISVGDIIVKNPEKNETLIPKDLGEFVGESVMSKRYSKDNILKSVEYSDMVNLWNGNVTSINYSPIPYTPQIIGFWIARFLQLSPLFTIFLVRLLNFITWIILAYFSIKLLPSKKIFATILYTSPAILSLVSTCNVDVLVLGLLLLLISYVLNLIQTKRNLNKKDYILMLFMSIGICTYKMFYVIYILFLFLIPKQCFENKNKKKVKSLLGIFMISLLIDFGWFALTSMESTMGNEVVSEQIRFILNNPFKYLGIFINTYINDIYYYITNFVCGTEMCYGLVRINELFIISYLFVLICSYFDGKKNPETSKVGKSLIVLVTLGIFGLVSTALYLDWTSFKIGIGAPKIVGIQSRYFFSLVIPLIMLLPNCSKREIKGKNIFKYAIILDTLLIVNCIQSLLIRVFPN